MALANFSNDTYQDVLRRVNEARMNRRNPSNRSDVCIVAVSKTKPKEMIIDAYTCGLRHFGENYINELYEKASDPEILEKCPDIKWHFIGHIQTNKVAKLLSTPNLHMIQTIDSIKLANILELKWSMSERKEELKVMVQVNTSKEEGKNGIEMDLAESLINHIRNDCPHLCCVGLMTIGSANHDLSQGPNPDFEVLSQIRKNLCDKDISPGTIDKPYEFDWELSMGMSDDYEHAIELGSTLVRVGRCLFGSRAKKD